MASPRPAVVALLLAAAIALSACESAEQRAEKHFAAAIALLQEGDADRALVELRNVFKLNAGHHDARLTYARLMRERGNLAEAYKQYANLVERFPQDVEGRRALTEMAIRQQDWNIATRNAQALIALVPGDAEAVAMNAVVDYVAAVGGIEAADAPADAAPAPGSGRPDSARAAAAVATARTVIDDPAAAPFARRILIDAAIRDGRFSAALDEVDQALQAEPEDLGLHGIKLQVLTALGDTAGVGAHLQAMAARFPGNDQINATLLGWHMQTGDLDGAEAFLRKLTEDPDPDRARQARVSLVQFLLDRRSPGAARAELDGLIAAGGADTGLWGSLRATIDFEAGAKDTAIADLEKIVAAAPADEQTDKFRVALARMLEETGRHDDARARIEEVLARDSGNVAALQMKAAWMIRNDRAAEAIGLLRTALDREPRNADTLTLMAEAHLRDGSRELAGERLALAVEASDNAAAESLRYARFLIEDSRLPTAETILVSALKRDPANTDLLAALGDLYLQQSDWTRVRDVITQLDGIGTETAATIGKGLHVSLLARQQKTDESLALLQQMIAEGDAEQGAAAIVVRDYLQRGDADGAESYLNQLLATSPDELQLRLLAAGLKAIRGDVAASETAYRALIEQIPTAPEPVQALYALLRSAGREADAAAALDAGASATGEAAPLLMLKASALERTRDYEGAVALYQKLYERDTSNAVIANNLASLITTHRDDPESLERAAVIARRLRGTKVPQFQDTYGWIESRRGNSEEALSYLEPAAKALSADPYVQLHLGLTYAALERSAEARAALENALQLAGDSDSPQFAKARALLQSLPAGE